MISHEAEILRIIQLTGASILPKNYTYFTREFHGDHSIEIFKNGFQKNVIQIQVLAHKDVYLHEDGTFEVDIRGETVLEGQYNPYLLRTINRHNFLGWSTWDWIFRRLTAPGA